MASLALSTEKILYRRLARRFCCIAWMLIASADCHAGELGSEIAATCAACHGTDGRSRGAIPRLAGRDSGELVRLMREFRDGRRPSTIMQQIARGYTDAEIEAAAAYFAQQKSP